MRRLLVCGLVVTIGLMVPLSGQTRPVSDPGEIFFRNWIKPFIPSADYSQATPYHFSLTVPAEWGVRVVWKRGVIDVSAASPEELAMSLSHSFGTAYCVDPIPGSYYDTADVGANVGPVACAPKPRPATFEDHSLYTLHSSSIEFWEFVTGGASVSFEANASSHGAAADIPSRSWNQVNCGSSGASVVKVGTGTANPAVAWDCDVLVFGVSPLAYTSWVGGGQNAYGPVPLGAGVVALAIQSVL